MAWIEFHQELPRHPKTDALMDELQIGRPMAVGMLAMSWVWALDFAPDGVIIEKRMGAAARGAGWDGQPRSFADAMVAAGWWDPIEGGYLIHNWMNYGGRLLEMRQAHAERSKRKRDLYTDYELVGAVRGRDGECCRYCGNLVNFKDRKGANGGTYDHIEPDGPNSIENIVVACRSCNSKKGKRTPSQAGMRLIPVDLPKGIKPISAQDLSESARVLSDSVENPLKHDTTQHDPTGQNQTQPGGVGGGGGIGADAPCSLASDPIEGPDSLLPPLDGCLPVIEDGHYSRQDGQEGASDSSPASSDVGEKTEAFTARSQPKPKRGAYTPAFEAFWKAWPGGGGKAEAFREWKAAGLERDEALRDEALSALMAQENWRKVAERNGRWVAKWPHACRWIKHSRWEDKFDPITDADFAPSKVIQHPSAKKSSFEITMEAGRQWLLEEGELLP